MTKDNQINVKVNDRTNESIEEFAESRDFTKAEACRRMIESRLVAEGYMKGVVRSDGGFEELQDDIEKAQSQIGKELEQTQDEINEVATEIQEFRSGLRAVAIPLLLSFVWIGAEVSLGIPDFGIEPWVTVGTGVVLLVWLITAYFQVITDD